MIKLLTIAIVAGLIYESHQKAKGWPNSGNPHNKRRGNSYGNGWRQSSNERPEGSHFAPMRPGCSAGMPCHNPTQISIGSPFVPMQPAMGLPFVPMQTGCPYYHPTQISVQPNCAPVQEGCSDEQPCSYPTHIQCWTPWFDRESITDDWETFQYLRRENPDEICPNPVDIQTNDQKVRFSCYPPFCGGGVCWTSWFDSVRSGDAVSVPISKASCDYPLYIEVVTAKSMTPAIDTGETFRTFNPTEGFVCRDVDQDEDKKCSNYRVRFGCACSEDNGDGSGEGKDKGNNGKEGQGNKGNNGKEGQGNKGNNGKEGEGNKGEGNKGNEGQGNKGEGNNGNEGQGNKGEGNNGKGNEGQGNEGQGNNGKDNEGEGSGSGDSKTRR